MKAALLPLTLLLIGCGRQSEADNAVAPIKVEILAPPGVKMPAARPFVLDEHNELIDFHYGWSAEAAAIPALAADLHQGMEGIKAEATEDARIGKAEDEKNGFEYRKHSYSSDYETAGQSARLLSLREEYAAYTGGAHGNFGTRGLLWDRSANKMVGVEGLFAAAANMHRLLTQRWCDALNKAREEKRDEAILGNGMFDDCPKLSDISIIPADKDENGRFERLLLVADPYVAGPYVEGSYEIDLPVTAELMSAIRADYRDGFEVQPQ